MRFYHDQIYADDCGFVLKKNFKCRFPAEDLMSHQEEFSECCGFV